MLEACDRMYVALFSSAQKHLSHKPTKGCARERVADAQAGGIRRPRFSTWFHALSALLNDWHDHQDAAKTRNQPSTTNPQPTNADMPLVPPSWNDVIGPTDMTCDATGTRAMGG